MIALRYRKLLGLFVSGDSFTAPEIAKIANMPRNRVTNGLCVLVNEGYLDRVKNETGRKGRMIYSLRMDVDLPEGMDVVNVAVPKHGFVAGKQSWFSPII